MSGAWSVERGANDENGESAQDATAVSRRQALKVLGAVPVAAAVGGGAAAAAVLVPELAAQAPAKSAPAPEAPTFFNPHEMKTVRVLVDYIIPRDARSGSATDAKVPEYMDYLLGEKDASESSQVEMRGGLMWVDTEMRKRFGKTFVDASDSQRRQLLDDIAYPDKARPEMRYGVTFFNRLRDMTASGFYSSAIGWRDVQYIGNVFNPRYDGCPPAALEKLGVSYDVMTTRVSPQER